MILLTILALITIVLIVITVAAIVIGGSGFIILFGDVIVCILVLIWIMYKLITKRR